MLTCDPLSAREIAALLVDARRRTSDLVSDLEDRELIVPLLPIVNPLVWEIGHVAWFQERWILRRDGARDSILPGADALYDSSAVAHDRRWELALPTRAETLSYMERVLGLVLERLASIELDDDERYYHELALFHEDMHGEALVQMRQTLGLREPTLSGRAPLEIGGGACSGDCATAGGAMLLGAEPGYGFVFDNEKWAHPVDVQPFTIARGAVTQAEFAAFVDSGGYRHGEYWTDAGWQWRQREDAEHPLYWKRANGAWLRRRFDRWVELEPQRAMIHVNAHEAEAYCRFANRRLPSEAEWEFAASWLIRLKKHFPWGWQPFDATLANLDGPRADTVDVGAFSLGDSPHGCRQMLGNVWEWTSSVLGPFPGFERDPYGDYSEPWFGTHRVLRGGSFATRARNIRNTWRNFYLAERRDVFAGFRTVAC